MRTAREKHGFLIGMLFFIAIMDRATKWFALFFFSKESVLFNDSFFSFIRIPPHIALLLVGAIFFFCLGWLIFSHGMRSIALLYILLGIGSNFTDRIVYGGVIDWISLPRMSTFNIADLCIIIGVSFLFVDLFFKKQKVV